jgi:hypothetical protein
MEVSILPIAVAFLWFAGPDPCVIFRAQQRATAIAIGLKPLPIAKPVYVACLIEHAQAGFTLLAGASTTLAT